MADIKLITDSWLVLLSIIAGVAWLIRIESKVLYLEKDHGKSNEANAKREEAMWKKFEEVNNKLTEALKSLSKIEGRLEHHNKD